jgi:hypothetical protein
MDIRLRKAYGVTWKVGRSNFAKAYAAALRAMAHKSSLKRKRDCANAVGAPWGGEVRLCGADGVTRLRDMTA